jgi:transcriptional regulator with XRE-family HTH domain
MKMCERLRLYIEANGFRMNFIAERAGIHPKRFYRLMNGSAPLTADEYETICRDGLSLDPGHFFQKNFLEVKKSGASA